MDELTAKVKDVNLDKDGSSESAEKEELPPELMSLIKEAVEDGTADEVEPRKEVTAEDLTTFFQRAVEKIRDKSLPEVLGAAVKGKEDKQEKLNSIKDVLNPLYEAIWNDLGVEYDVGKHAIQEHQSILQDASVAEEAKRQLAVGIKLFSGTEQRLVRRALMGEEAYEQQLEEEKKVAEVRDELFEKLQGLDAKEQAKLVVDLKNQGAELRERLKSLGQEEAVKYITKPTPEDQQLLYKLSALTMIMGPQGCQDQGGSCCNHGHAQQAGKHEHSHKGKPCSGHH